MKKAKILFVDDSAEWLKSHLSMLESFFGVDNFEIEIAYSAREGINTVLCAEIPFDIVVTDMEMEDFPDCSYAGENLLKALVNKEECKDTKFVVISGAYNIAQIAKKYDCAFISKSDLVANPLIFKYTFEQLLKS